MFKVPTNLAITVQDTDHNQGFKSIADQQVI